MLYLGSTSPGRESEEKRKGAKERCEARVYRGAHPGACACCRDRLAYSALRASSELQAETASPGGSRSRILSDQSDGELVDKEPGFFTPSWDNCRYIYYTDSQIG